MLAVLLLAMALARLGTSLAHRAVPRPCEMAITAQDEVSAILDKLEDGRLSARQAVRRVAGSQRGAHRNLITLASVGFAWANGPFILRLPFVPLAMIATGAETFLYPPAYVVLGLIALLGRKGGLQQFLACFPALPVTRLVLALLRARAPLSIGVGGGTFSFSIE
jgi:hypothetical protein